MKCAIILFFVFIILRYFWDFPVIETLVETPTYNNTRAQFVRDMSSVQQELTQIDSDLTNIVKNVSGGMYGNTISGNTKIQVESEITKIQQDLNMNGVIDGLNKLLKI